MGARDNHADLEQLLRRYWQPIYAFLRRRGNAPDDAADLTQSFLLEVMLERDLLGKADRHRGRFRSFLITALRNFVVDEHRRKYGRERKGLPRFVPDDPELLGRAEPHASSDAEQAFDRQWAVSLISRVLERLEAECHQHGLTPHWTIFEERVLGPIRDSGSPIALAQIAKQVDARGPGEASHMLYTVKRKARTVFYEVLSETVETPDDVENELRELRRALEN